MTTGTAVISNNLLGNYSNKTPPEIGNELIINFKLHKNNMLELMNKTFAFCNENGIEESKSIEVLNYLMDYRHSYQAFHNF